MSWRFITCTGLFVTCLLTANVIATKLVVVGGLTLTAGIVIFPISYVLGDVLTEVWGYAATRRVIWLGFACNALMVLAIWLGGELPAAPFWRGEPAYQEILGHTPRILMASFVAYLIGEFANAFVLAKLKIATHGIVAGQWLVKVVYEAAATPLTYAAVAWLKSREQVDTFDYDTDFNPVRLRG